MKILAEFSQIALICYSKRFFLPQVGPQVVKSPGLCLSSVNIFFKALLLLQFCMELNETRYPQARRPAKHWTQPDVWLLKVHVGDNPTQVYTDKSKFFTQGHINFIPNTLSLKIIHLYLRKS